MSEPNPSKIVKAEVTGDHVEVTLANGTRCYLSSNRGYVHLHMSYINPEKAIEVANQAANQLDILYTPVGQ